MCGVALTEILLGDKSLLGSKCSSQSNQTGNHDQNGHYEHTATAHSINQTNSYSSEYHIGSRHNDCDSCGVLVISETRHA